MLTEAELAMYEQTKAWPILGVLDGLYAAQGEQAQAQRLYKDAAVIIHHLSGTIDELDLRMGFLAADRVRSILEIGEGV